MLVIPGIDGLAVAARVLRRLKREFEHAHVRADGGQVDVKSVQNPAGWDGEIVKTLADGGVSNGHGSGLAGQSAEPDQFVAPDLHRFTGLRFDCYGEIGQGDDLRRQRQEYLALTVPARI